MNGSVVETGSDEQWQSTPGQLYILPKHTATLRGKDLPAQVTPSMKGCPQMGRGMNNTAPHQTVGQKNRVIQRGGGANQSNLKQRMLFMAPAHFDAETRCESLATHHIKCILTLTVTNACEATSNLRIADGVFRRQHYSALTQ